MKIKKGKGPVEKIKMRTKSPSTDLSGRGECFEWWKSASEEQLAKELCGTAAYLKTNQTYRIRQIAASIRMYAGLSVYSYAGSNVSKMDRTRTLPDDKPTFNLIRACVDTLHSRLSQNEPQPKFLTDNADYKQRHLAQQLNMFTLGEFYQVKAYEKAAKILKDGLTIGCGALKIFEGEDKKVAVERVLVSDLYVDDNDSINGEPQQLIQLKLVDREKFYYERGRSKEEKAIIERTPNSYPDNSADSGRTASDQIMVAEGWRLATGPDPEAEFYQPGRHTIATVEGVVGDNNAWKKNKFPLVFFNYSDPWLGFFGQGIGTQLFGTQLSLQRVLYTISRAITLVGVPRVFIDQSSKVVKAHNNNEIGVIVTYSGTKPSYEVAPCNAPELYAERDKLIQYGFQETGVSSMQATSQKPDGLDSGAAIRSYDDIATDRFAAISKKYDNVFIDLAYQIVDVAKDIAERDGKYQTVYPNKDGTKEIDLPAMKFLKDPFVIKCFSESALPRTPSGRLAELANQLQAGAITLKEYRRLAHLPDLEQNEELDNSSEERIFKYLDAIVEDGKYTGPDEFMDIGLAIDLSVKYYNLYVAANLEEAKADMLRDFYKQCLAIQQAGQPPPTPAPVPQANPQPLPTSPLVPNGNPPAGGGMARGGRVKKMDDGGDVSMGSVPNLPGGQTDWGAGQIAGGFQPQADIQTANQSDLANQKALMDMATSAFKYSSPAGYAASEAGNPNPQGDILGQLGGGEAGQAIVNPDLLSAGGKRAYDTIKNLAENGSSVWGKILERLDSLKTPENTAATLLQRISSQKELEPWQGYGIMEGAGPQRLSQMQEEIANTNLPESQMSYVKGTGPEEAAQSQAMREEAQKRRDAATEEIRQSSQKWANKPTEKGGMSAQPGGRNPLSPDVTSKAPLQNALTSADKGERIEKALNEVSQELGIGKTEHNAQSSIDYLHRHIGSGGYTDGVLKKYGIDPKEASDYLKIFTQ